MRGPQTLGRFSAEFNAHGLVSRVPMPVVAIGAVFSNWPDEMVAGCLIVLFLLVMIAYDHARRGGRHA